MNKWNWLFALGLAAALPMATQAGPVGSNVGLVGQWKLENAGATAFDTSGYNSHGVAFGGSGVSWGWQDSGVDLTGEKFFKVPNTPNLNFGTGDFTFAAWVRMNSTSGIKTIVDARGSTGGYSFAIYQGQHVLLQMADSTGWLNYVSNGSITLVPDQWHHVAVSVVRASVPGPRQPLPRITFYIDGQAAGTASPKMGNINNIDQPVLLGGQKEGYGNFNDRLDEVMVYNRALGSTGVAQIMAPGLPNYEPAFWNASARPSNNCYNYANNHQTNTFAQPGRARGAMYTALTCAAVHAAADADGLEPISTINAASYKDLVALVVAPGYDYHWYRRDANGYWTHKPGGTNATNLDNAGNTIANPETANRGPYSDFCGYFRLWSDNVQGAGHEHIN
jgi:hypothetical protein